MIPSRKVLPAEAYRAASVPSSSLGFSSSSVSQAGAPLQALIDKVKPNPRQPREHFSHTAIEELIASIKEHGVLQPLVVTANVDGTYELIAGERRLRAAKLAGLATVPVIIRTANEQQKLELALIENLQRQDLSPIEEAKAFRLLLEEYDLTQEEVAGKMGKSRGYVANTVRLLNLPEEAQTAVSKGYITASNARTLAGLESEAEQKKWLQKMMKEGMTAREAERMVTKKKRAMLRDPQVAADEETLREALGTKVTIEKKAGRGIIAIGFYSDEEYRGLIKRLKK
ncbi:ParB/RepB/Spo0J family partition protein [Candidatus Uhrbacteria bacterium]|nr:ParB/RepB/Spo0J family partition protein [Candidatus Uhrbacteria bacterium]